MKNQEEIPNGWKKESVADLFIIQKGKKPSELFDEPAPNKIKYLIVDSINNNGTKYALKGDGITCDVDDLLIIADGSRSGHLFTGHSGLVSSTFLMIRPKNNTIHKKFLFYSLSNLGLTDTIFRKGGAIPHFDYSKFKMQGLYLPPLPEQEQIAKVLTNVDENIEETNKIIVECERIKNGLMQTLLIKGIPNRHKKFKQTEFGEIPEEWNFKRLSQISSKIGDGLHSTPKYVDSSEYFFINGNNLLDGSIIINDRTKCVDKEEFHKYYIPLTNRTILMSINGTIGNLANFNDEKVILGKSAAYITLDSSVDKTFIFYLLQYPIIKKFYDDELTGTTIRNLSLKSIRNTPIPLPSIEEQQEISEIMLKIDERILLEKTKQQQTIVLKKSLMQKLLSGDIRVKV